MAYLEFPATGGGVTLLDRPVHTPKGFRRTGTPASLTALEWQVVALAQRDKFASIRSPGRVMRAVRWMFGLRVSNALSDARLEALRRISVLSWYRGFAVASAEVRAFLAAGFTPDQYELLLERISAARASLPRRFRR